LYFVVYLKGKKRNHKPGGKMITTIRKNKSAEKWLEKRTSADSANGETVYTVCCTDGHVSSNNETTGHYSGPDKNAAFRAYRNR
jgi:hypothetical protein